MKYLILFILMLPTFGYHTLKVGLFDVEPFGYMNSKKAISGVSYLYLKKLENELGFTFEYVLLPYTRVISSLKDGSIDLAMFYPSDEFEQDFLKLVETVGNDNLIILKKSATQLTDLSGLSIARIGGAKYSKDFDSNLSIKKVNARSYINEINFFSLGRVDGFVIPAVALKHVKMTTQFEEKIFKHQLLLNHQKNWIHVRKNLDKKIREKIIDANNILLKKNKFKKLDELYDELQ